MIDADLKDTSNGGVKGGDEEREREEEGWREERGGEREGRMKGT